jgi:DNA repair protein RecN (Recombination protein N)
VRVLCELRVEGLLLIEQAQLRLAPGLNVLTGETGAGKTMLAHALDLLMGGRARAGIVRPGAREAYVEGCFAIEDTLASQIEQALPESVTLDAGGLTLARRVGTDGRTRAYVNGRSAPVASLRALGSIVLSFYGQHEHRKLMLAGAQLQILDESCGPGQQRLLDECAESYARARRLEAELERVRSSAAGSERDLLEHEIAEIEQAAIEPGEHEQLLERRERLRLLDALRAASGAAGEALAGELGEGFGAAQLMAAAAAKLGALAGVDSELDALAGRCAALAIEAQDAAGELRAYSERLAGEDGSLQVVEERLAQVERLMRKHGGTLEAVLERLAVAQAQRDELAGAERQQAALDEQLAEAQGRLQRHARELRLRRREAALALEREVRSQLGALAMQDATFEVRLLEGQLRASGADEAQFTIAPNPGVQAAPLREIASGGELSRVMLALATVASRGGLPAASHRGPEPVSEEGRVATSTLVFDEIDAGIGGHTARAVGERLRDLARHRQVLCITHLPQLASLAERHFTIAKHSAGGATSATVMELDASQVLGELVRMLGADERDAGARRHARELLRAA